MEELAGNDISAEELETGLYVLPEIACAICEKHFQGRMVSFVKSLIVFFASKQFGPTLEAGLLKDIESPVVHMLIPKVPHTVKVVGRA